MTVDEVIRLDIVNDDTSISIFDFNGRNVASDIRYYEAGVIYRGHFEIYSFNYFPSTNTLYIYIAYYMNGRQVE